MRWRRYAARNTAVARPLLLAAAVPTILFSPATGVLTKDRLIELEAHVVARDTGLSFRTVRVPSRLVRTILCKHRFYEEETDGGPWSLYWTCRHIVPQMLALCGPYARINHFPGSFELTRKDRLWRTFRRYRERASGCAAFSSFVPETLCLPADVQALAAWQAREEDELAAASASGATAGPDRLWIVKPAAGSYGRGIVVLPRLSDFAVPDKPVVLQEYVARPLLVGGKKFDMRLYVLVTSYDPLRVYLFRNGLARFAVEPYDVSASLLDRPHVHLTNVTLNRNHPAFVKNESAADDSHGTVWSLRALRAHLADAMGVDVPQAFAAVESLIVQSLIAVQPSIAGALRRFSRSDDTCFELYGYDVMFDECVRPWLLEVNAFPSVLCGTPMDLAIKSALVADVLTLAGIVPVEYRRASPGPSIYGSGRSAGPHYDHATLVARVRREWAAPTDFDCIYPVPDGRYDELLHPTAARYSAAVLAELFAAK